MCKSGVAPNTILMMHLLIISEQANYDQTKTHIVLWIGLKHKMDAQAGLGEQYWSQFLLN